MSVPPAKLPLRRGLSRSLLLLPTWAAASVMAQGAAPEPAPAASQAQASQRVTVKGTAVRDDGPFAARSSQAQLGRSRAASNDTARLLQDVPGLSLYGAGGVSSLPAIHGLADDRLRTQVDGMDLMAACPNHMNPVLSYIDPSNVGQVKVYAGISPVSVGGDSIGGTIQVEAAAPEFALTGEPALHKGRLGTFYRSSGAARGGNLSASFATESLNFSFNTATARQNNFRAARAFKPAVPGSETGPVIPGDEVGSSAYQAHNQELRAAWRDTNHLLKLSLARQQIGFEGFPNQRMDMTDNRGTQVNLRYTGQFDWGQLKARAWQQKVDHAMDMGPDRFFYGFGMPMLTEATTRGVMAQADVNLGQTDTLRLGAERQTYVLFDWWPPVGGSMGPRDFWNVDDGRRIRAGAFAEWEATWSPRWSTLAGVRADRVDTHAGPVQGYDNGLGAIWGNEATAFNALQRQRSDDMVDLALMLRFRPEATTLYELGLAQKSRAPSLYQRYPGPPSPWPR
jgi:iron complex outermembrane recepter protein